MEKSFHKANLESRADLSWLNRPLQTWFKDARVKPFPLAPSLNCSDCSRANHAVSAVEAERWRKWKCCTFQPFVPNYLIGSMLESKPLAKTSNGVLSPLGLCPTSDYRTRFFSKEDS